MGGNGKQRGEGKDHISFLNLSKCKNFGQFQPFGTFLMKILITRMGVPVQLSCISQALLMIFNVIIELEAKCVKYWGQNRIFSYVHNFRELFVIVFHLVKCMHASFKSLIIIVTFVIMLINNNSIIFCEISI